MVKLPTTVYYSIKIKKKVQDQKNFQLFFLEIISVFKQ